MWELEWKTIVTKPKSLVTLVLKYTIKPEFIDKLSEVWLSVGFIVYSGTPEGGVVVVNVPSSHTSLFKLIKSEVNSGTPGGLQLMVSSNVPSNYASPFRSMQSIGNSTALVYQHKLISYPTMIIGWTHNQDAYNLPLNKFDTHMSAEVYIVSIPSIKSLSDVPHDLKSDFGALLSFDSKNSFSDVTLVVSPKNNDSSNSDPVEFFAHKVILAARSPVFASMFEHNMQERSSSKVNLTDVEPATVKEMLIYMYSDRVPKIGEVAGDLLYVADKYQLENLKKICEEHLSSNLRVDNAARIIQLAYLYNAPQLKRLCLQFISDHGSEVRATQEWDEVKQCPDNADILDDLLKVVFEPPTKRPRT